MTEEEKKEYERRSKLAESWIAQNCGSWVKGGHRSRKPIRLEPDFTFLWTTGGLMIDVSFPRPEASDFFILATIPIDIFRFRVIKANLRICCTGGKKGIKTLDGIADEVTEDLNLSFLELQDFSGMPQVRKDIWIVGTRFDHFRGFNGKLHQLKGDTDYIKTIPGYRAFALIEKVSYDKI